MIYIIVILIIINIAVLTYAFLIKYDIRYMAKQIEKNKWEYTTIKMKSLDKDLEELVKQINELYDACNRKNINVINKEKELRGKIANISHDLRTPLTSIMGYLELLKDKNIQEIEKKRYFNIVIGRTKILQNLISSFYSLSLIESDDKKFNLKSINLKNILVENIAFYYNEFKYKNIEPKIVIDDNLPNIISDEEAVTRIFINLLNNILKHAKQDVIIKLIKQDNKIVSEFINRTDNLDEEDILHIFDSFFIKDYSRNNENTGLGLYIVKTLTEKLGNTIEAKLNNDMLSIKIIWII